GFVRTIGRWSYTSSLTDGSMRIPAGWSPRDLRRFLSETAVITPWIASGVNATWKSTSWRSERPLSFATTGKPRSRPNGDGPRALRPSVVAASSTTLDGRTTDFEDPGKSRS